MKPIILPLYLATLSLAAETYSLAPPGALQPRGCGASCLKQQSSRSSSPGPPMSRASSSSSGNHAQRTNTRPEYGSTNFESVRGSPTRSNTGLVSDMLSPGGSGAGTASDRSSPARSRSSNSSSDLDSSVARRLSSSSSSGAPSDAQSFRTMSSSSSISNARTAISATREPTVPVLDDAAKAQEAVDRQKHPADIEARIKGPVWVWSQKGVFDRKENRRLVKANEETVKHWSSQKNVYKHAQVGKGGSIVASAQGRTASMTISRKQPSDEPPPTVRAWTPEVGGFNNQGRRVRATSDSVTQPAIVAGGLDGKGQMFFAADNSHNTRRTLNQPERGTGWYPPNYPGRRIG